MVLSCVKRMGERFGAGMTAKVLKGSKDKKIKDFRLDQLSTYGLMSAYTEKELTNFIHFLVAENYLSPGDGRYPILRLTQQAADVLKGRQQVWMQTGFVKQASDSNVNDQLFDVLRKLRKQIADEEKVPPYVLFSDAALKEMCQQLPKTKQEMLMVKGVGEKKYEQYGERFLEEIKSWADRPLIEKSGEEPSHLVSYRSFSEGMSIKQIALARNITEQTAANHLFKAFQEGYPLDWDSFFTAEQEEEVLQARARLEEPKLKPLKESLPETYDYDLIKAVLIKHGYMK